MESAGPAQCAIFSHFFSSVIKVAASNNDKTLENEYVLSPTENFNQGRVVRYSFARAAASTKAFAVVAMMMPITSPQMTALINSKSIFLIASIKLP